MSCTAFPAEYITRRIGVLVPSFSFLTSLSRPLTPLPKIHSSRSSLVHLWQTSWMRRETRHCSAPSEPSRTISARSSSSGFCVPLYSSQRLKGRNGCLKTPFHFWIKSEISYACQSAINEHSRAVRFKVHKVRKIGTSLLFSFKRAVQSSRYWRLGLGLKVANGQQDNETGNPMDQAYEYAWTPCPSVPT